jgi:hypothetical protein
MRMLVSVEFTDAGAKTGTHRVLGVGGCSDATAPGDVCITEITETAGRCKLCGARPQIKDWSRRSVHTLLGRVPVQATRLASCCCTGERPRALCRSSKDG